MAKKIGLLHIITLFAAGAVYGEQLEFRYRLDDRYRILSTVEQAVSINGKFAYRATILNRIAVEVAKVEGERGYLTSSFIVSEESRDASRPFQVSREYESRYWRDRLGRYDIEPRFFVPVVRDVPILLDQEVSAGDSWQAIGREVQDFRGSLGLPTPYHYEFPVDYTYLGEQRYNGELYPALQIRYIIRHNDKTLDARAPRQVTGFAEQIVYWDRVNGRPLAYNEDYLIEIELDSGERYQFEGVAYGEVIESAPLRRVDIQREVERHLADAEIDDVDVRPDERGVTLSLQNIQFPPDSSLLLPAEREKIARIATILTRYPDRDILVSGHTALAGDAEGRMTLSTDRASAVAQALFELAVRARDRLLVQGFGAEQPIATNLTEEGRVKNRRVEITILEN